MSLGINSNVPGLQANRNLYRANWQTSKALQKLSSGLRINQGQDDPAGLIISELLRSQIGGYERALRNTQEANNVMSIAEGGLGSVSSMLTNMKGLAIHSMNSGITSSAQVSADQAELNSLLNSINRVVSTTSYAGRNLLNGAQDFTYNATDQSGIIDSADIQSVSGTASGEIAIEFAGGEAAQAERAYLEADFGAETLAGAQEFSIVGTDGARNFQFAAGTSIADMAAQINAATGSTGVEAYAIRDQGSGATALRIASTKYGSDSMTRVEQRTGDAFAAAGTTVADYGKDASLTVNGANVATNGLIANVQTNDFTGRISFNAEGQGGATSIAQIGYDRDELVNAADSRQASLNNISGGMQLQLGGGAGGQNRERISLGNYNPATLGRVVVDGETYALNDLYSGGRASLANNPEVAMRIVDQAISDVASGRADIGAYQSNALDTNANNLMVAIENVTATESRIRDTDMARTITQLLTARMLEDAGLRGIQSSNMTSQSVARLLGMGG
ncbi:MAG: hypothetical protein LBJ46_02110 [Planctomycetota bacterium]|jgi:flagellin|nr:hypothetical protein [Planctomycetota bacterium]